MKTLKQLICSGKHMILGVLVSLAMLTATIGSAFASAWGGYQPKVPESMRRQ